jgi:hypothetical protein
MLGTLKICFWSAIIVSIAGRADAGLIATGVALLASSAGAGAIAASAIGVIAAVGAVVGAGASLASSVRSGAQASGRRRRDALQQPSETPVKRIAFGFGEIPATPLKHYRSGKFMYGPYILSSQPITGGDPALGDLYFIIDGRLGVTTSDFLVTGWGDDGLGNPVHFQGDCFDFSGDGYAVRPDGFPSFFNDDRDKLRYWIGRGDQKSPPDRILSEMTTGDFMSSDGGEGLSILWCRWDLDKIGEYADIQERWPSWNRTPPVTSVVTKGVAVWDPRDPAQDKDDPSTWAYSANQALCLLHAIRRNGVSNWPDDQIDLAGFIAGANLADTTRDLGDGYSEPLFEINGVMQFSESELRDSLEAMARAGAGRLDISAGRISYIPAEWREVTYTVRDVLMDQPLEMVHSKDSSEIPREVTVTYTRPSRQFADHELPPTSVRSDGTGERENITLAMVTSTYQAQHIQSIIAARRAAQKSATMTLLPEAFDVVTGSTILMDIPGLSRMNGYFEVKKCDPTVWVRDASSLDSGVALRIPVEVEEVAESFYAEPVYFEVVDEDNPDLKGVTVSDLGGAGEIRVQARITTAASSYYTSIAVYRGPTGGSFADATRIAVEAAPAIDTVENYDLIGVALGEADFWVAGWTPQGLSPIDGPHTVTVT